MVVIASCKSTFNATKTFLFIVTIFLVINYNFPMDFDHYTILATNGAFLFFGQMPVKYTAFIKDNVYYIQENDLKPMKINFDRNINNQRIISFMKRMYNIKMLVLVFMFNILMIVFDKTMGSDLKNGLIFLFCKLIKK